MSSSKRTLLIFGGVLVVLTVVSPPCSATARTPPPWTRKTIGRNRIVETVIASGRIQPEVEVKISAEVSGQLIELPVREGDRVEAGQLLARINPDIFESRLSQSKAALDNARSNRATAAARLAQSKAAFAAAELPSAQPRPARQGRAQHGRFRAGTGRFPKCRSRPRSRRTKPRIGRIQHPQHRSGGQGIRGQPPPHRPPRPAIRHGHRPGQGRGRRRTRHRLLPRRGHHEGLRTRCDGGGRGGQRVRHRQGRPR